MAKLQKIFKVYSIIFIAFGFISFAFSAFSDILGLINENIRYDTISETQMMPFINGGVFIIIGGLLEMLSGLYGYKASDDIRGIFKPILFSVLAISWQITGFIILFSNHHFNVRLVLQIPLTFIFLVMAFLIKFKSTDGIKKKHVDLNPLTKIGTGERKIRQKNIANIFQTNHTRKHIHIPVINSGRRVKRINIKPKRRFKR